MSVIIRLQNLPWSANALDIRQYFHGLGIPEGGVHIVGGELGDAFIAFSTDEDARQAFNRNNGKIKEIQIKLMLSSRTEMQRVIEQARSQSMAAFMLPSHNTVTPLPAAVPPVVPAPAPVPEIRKETSPLRDRDSDKKRDRRRSRSKSRDRDRDRNRKDRKHRDRSRSRSRERRDRRRRDRSRSRNRSRSRDRRRIDRDNRDVKRNDDVAVRPPVWVNPTPQLKPEIPTGLPVAGAQGSILGTYSPLTLDQAKRALVENLSNTQLVNGFPLTAPFGNNNNRPGSNRESWPPTNVQSNFGRSSPDEYQHQPANRPMRNDMRLGQRDMNPRSQRGGFNAPRGPRNVDMNEMRNPRNQEYNEEFEPAPYENRKMRKYDEQPPNSCVQLEPFYGSYADLRRFFTGLQISFRGIKLINDDYGHKTGLCYVQFAGPQHRADALDRNGMSLNNMEVKVEPISDEEFREAIDRFVPTQSYGDDSGGRYKTRNITKYFNNSGPPEPEIKDFVCLKVEGLPTYVKEQDILHMFSQHALFSLHIDSKPRGGSVAYAKFTSKEVAKLALEEKSQHVIGGKPVTVKPCKDSEFEQINQEHSAILEDTKPEPTIDTDCLSISKLPAKTNDRDLSDFFSEIGVIPTKIHLMNNNIGFTGQAYCEFESKEEATAALAKNNTALGSNIILVKPIKRDEMESILDNSVQHPNAGLAEDDVSEEGPVMQLDIPNSQMPFGPAGPQQFGPRPMLQPPRGRGRGGPRFGTRGGPRGMRFSPRMQEPGYEDAPPGCTVYMDNVPYKAGTNEILEFFEGYNSTNNVSRRYTPNNMPSAEAKIIFPSPDDAFRAVKELNGKKIWERSIYLTQV